jgi:hypothetical protein
MTGTETSHLSSVDIENAMQDVFSNPTPADNLTVGQLILKQQSAGRHVAPLEHIILVPSQPLFPSSQQILIT